MDRAGMIRKAAAAMLILFALAALVLDAGDVERFAAQSLPADGAALRFAAEALAPLDGPFARGIGFLHQLTVGGIAEERYRQIVSGLLPAEWLAGRIEAGRALIWLFAVRLHLLLWHALLGAALWAALALDGMVMRRVRFAEYRAPGPETHEAAGAAALCALPAAAFLLMLPLPGTEGAALGVMAAGGVALRVCAGSFHRYL